MPANLIVSAFVRNNALKTADHLIRKHERLVLSNQDWEIVLRTPSLDQKKVIYEVCQLIR